MGFHSKVADLLSHSYHCVLRVGWEVNVIIINDFKFSERGFAGSRARKPRWEFKRSALEQFFCIVLRLNGALNV